MYFCYYGHFEIHFAVLKVLCVRPRCFPSYGASPRPGQAHHIPVSWCLCTALACNRNEQISGFSSCDLSSIDVIVTPSLRHFTARPSPSKSQCDPRIPQISVSQLCLCHGFVGRLWTHHLLQPNALSKSKHWRSLLTLIQEMP